MKPGTVDGTAYSKCQDPGPENSDPAMVIGMIWMHINVCKTQSISNWNLAAEDTEFPRTILFHSF